MAKQEPWDDEFSLGGIPREGRRHDLDALRGIAMLLGVVLHAALAYFPMIWPVQDQEQAPILATVVDAIHGFRMPLFFLLSGYFTCLLWRDRGLLRTSWQRTRKIVIPLLIGVFTIVPLTDRAVDRGISDFFQREDREVPEGEPENLWAAARQGNIPAMERMLASSANPERRDPDSRKTPLNWAATEGQVEVARFLIEEGVPVDGLSRGVNTPLHAAAFYGRVEVARVLLEAGANPEMRNIFRMTPADGMLTDWPTTFLIAQAEAVDVQQGEVLAGRREIAAMMRERGVAIPEDDRLSPLTLRERIKLLQDEPFFHHLWFLAFLIWFLVLFPLSTPLLRLLQKNERLNHNLIRLPGLFVCFLLTTYLHREMTPLGFGAQTSLGLIPDFTVLAYYAVFFWMGAAWLLADDSRTSLGRDWWFSLPFALMVVLPLGRWFREPSRANPLSPSFPEYAPVAESLYVWLMVSGMIGLARVLLDRESRLVRSLSEASYWIYVVHLPLVIYAQLWLREWEVNVWVKYLSIVFGVSIGLYLIDRTLVRYTPLRWLFHSTASRRKKASNAAPSLPS